MKPRNHLPETERLARSKATKLIHDNPFIAGGLVEMARTCGNPRCKCAKGDKHVSWYLATRYKGARKMISIPRQLEKDITEWVNTYKELTRQIDIISQQCLERFVKSAKAQRGKDS